MAVQPATTWSDNVDHTRLMYPGNIMTAVKGVTQSSTVDAGPDPGRMRTHDHSSQHTEHSVK